MLRRLLCLSFLCCLLAPRDVLAQDPGLSDCKSYRFDILGTGTTAETGELKKGVSLQCDETQLFADEIKWNETTLLAWGNVVLVQDGLRLTADRMEMDRATRLGTFYVVSGTARLTDKPVQGSQFGTLEPEVSFHAAKLERLGPKSYRMTDGWFSTCVQANPRWDIRGSSGSVILDERVLLRNALLRVKGIPVIYVPFLYYPLGEDDRSTGFLLPTYSTSTLRGHGLSNAFFWAIGRSHDATIYHDYFSKSGQGVAAQYRFASAPGSNGELRVNMMDEKEQRDANGNLQRTGHRSYDIRGQMNSLLPRGFRFIGRANYFTDVSSIQLYQQDLFDLSRHDRYFNGSITRNFRYYRFQALAERRDVYTDRTTAQRRGRLPQVNFWVSGLRVKNLLQFGFDGEVAGIENIPNISQPATSTSLWRADARPTVRFTPRGLSFLSGSAYANWRLTHWTDSLDPLTGTPRPVAITRPLAEIGGDIVGPTVSRVFNTPKNGYAEKFQHKIQPRVSVQWFSAFDRFNEVIKNDPGVDSLVGGNATLTYSLDNIVLAKRLLGGGTSRATQILRVGVSQSYYTEASAGAFDTQYQTPTAGKFSPVQINATMSPTDSTSGRFQMYLDSKTLQAQSYSASIDARGPRGFLQAGWSKRQYLPGVPGFDNPLSASHFLNGTASLHSSSGRVGGAFGFNVDLREKSFLQHRYSVFYNAQCCGLSVDYQVMSLSHIRPEIKSDRRFNFSFTLAGIGSFSNPLGSFGR
jgi:LPS-assembly protein